MLGRLFLSLISNILGILAAAHFVSGFIFSGTFIDLIVAALILTAIHIFIRPVLKFLLGPLIILTLGLFIIVINALTLFILDFASTAITIQGYAPLLIATIIFGAINVLVHFSAKSVK